MPKKPNGSGGMQEYIPAGNGDASGEYGNSKGENKHFGSFKKGSSAKNSTPKRNAKTESGEKVVNGYVIGKGAGGQYTVYNNAGHFEEDKNRGYKTEAEAIKRANSLKKGIAVEEKDEWGEWAEKTDKEVPSNWKPNGFDGDTRFYDVENQKGVESASIRPDGLTTFYTSNGYLTFDSLEEAQDFLNIKDKKQATDKLWERGWLGAGEENALDDIYSNKTNDEIEKDKEYQYNRAVEIMPDTNSRRFQTILREYKNGNYKNFDEFINKNWDTGYLSNYGEFKLSKDSQYVKRAKELFNTLENNKPQEKPETQKPSKAKATSSNKVTYDGKDYDVDSTAYNGAIINAFGTSITDEKKQGLGGNGYTVFDGGDEIYFDTFDEAYNYAKKNERKKASKLFNIDL